MSVDGTRAWRFAATALSFALLGVAVGYAGGRLTEPAAQEGHETSARDRTRQPLGPQAGSSGGCSCPHSIPGCLNDPLEYEEETHDSDLHVGNERDLGDDTSSLDASTTHAAWERAARRVGFDKRPLVIDCRPRHCLLLQPAGMTEEQLRTFQQVAGFVGTELLANMHVILRGHDTAIFYSREDVEKEAIDDHIREVLNRDRE